MSSASLSFFLKQNLDISQTSSKDSFMPHQIQFKLKTCMKAISFMFEKGCVCRILIYIRLMYLCIANDDRFFVLIFLFRAQVYPCQQRIYFAFTSLPICIHVCPHICNKSSLSDVVRC